MNRTEPRWTAGAAPRMRAVYSTRIRAVQRHGAISKRRSRATVSAEPGRAKQGSAPLPPPAGGGRRRCDVVASSLDVESPIRTRLLLATLPFGPGH